MLNRTKIKSVVLVCVLVLTVWQAAAGGSREKTAVNQSGEKAAHTNQPSFHNSEEGGMGKEGGVEAALVTYSDSSQGFSIGYPGPWTRDSSVTQGVRFTGGDDSLTLQLVRLPAGTDLMTYVNGDGAKLHTQYAGFKKLFITPSPEVKDAIILGFQSRGSSVVTGKSYTARADRYYIALKGGRIAVITVNGPASHYDREGARDIALTLRVKQ